MFFIECPYCHEPRSEGEFTRVEEAFIKRPETPDSIDDHAWSDYLFNSTNTKGIFSEQWNHVHGCGKHFVVERNTSNNEIIASHPIVKKGKKSESKQPAQKLPKGLAKKKKSLNKKPASKR